MSHSNIIDPFPPSDPYDSINTNSLMNSEEINRIDLIQRHRTVINSIQEESIQKQIIQGFQYNEDVCFKCKQYGQIYGCENCFRSFHWKCIGSRKMDELSKMTHTINFICESCDTQSNCFKCNSVFPKTKFDLIDFSDQSSILTLYKCSHCYIKIHKKCLDLPLEMLNKKLQESTINQEKHLLKNELFTHYLCVRCLQNVGITQIIKTQRLCNSLGVQTLYYYVLLNTNSPIHKGWVEEYTLRKHLKRFSGDQNFISEFILNNSLFENPQIDKIIAIRFPIKHRRIMISDVIKVIENKNKLLLNERYGQPDNFQFLVKWKQRDYSSLTWEDETIVQSHIGILRDFLIQKQNQCCLIQHVTQIQSKRKTQNSTSQINYKVLEYFLSQQPKLTQKLLLQKKEIRPKIYERSISKSFQQRMTELDEENTKNSFMEIIEVDFQNCQRKKENDYIHRLTSYFQKCYLTEIILRPTLIVTDKVSQWEETIKSRRKFETLHLKFVKFYGSKSNTNAIKEWDFFACTNPTLYKFHVILIDYNYFLHENKFLFEKIPSFNIVLFDQYQRFREIPQKLKIIEKSYLPLRSKILKQIYLIESSNKNQHKEDFINTLLSLNTPFKNPMKKAVLHSLDFSKVKEFVPIESNLKLKLEKRYKEMQRVFELPSNKTLNQGQRLSFLKFILSFGLNVNKIQTMCIKMRQINPSIWSLDSGDSRKMEEMVKEYLPFFMSVISNSQKDHLLKLHKANLNYFLFNYTGEMVFKRIIQLKRLKTELQKSSEDHSKFPVNKPFKFFSSGQCKNFPLWNTYEDYTLGALMIEEGYQMWSNIINSRKWADYHSQLQTRKVYQFDSKAGTFIVQEKIVAIKKTTPLMLAQSRAIADTAKRISNQEKGDIEEINDIESFVIEEEEQIPTTYGDYLLKKIRNSKEFKEIQFEKLNNLSVLQGHIAERGDFILLSMN